MTGSIHRSPITASLTVAAMVFLFVPLLVVVLFSFHSTTGLSFPFEGLSLRWYEEVVNSFQFRAALENSLIIGLITAALTFVLGTGAAYALTRSRSRLRAPLALLFFLPITLPGLVVGIALLVFFNRIELDLSLTTVAIAHVVFVFPYFLLIARAALDRLDLGLEENAADLGASSVQVFRLVTWPQIWPVLAGATALAFVLSFDEFIITFFVIGSDSTLPLYIWSSLRRTTDPTINVISTMLLLVTIALSVLAFLLAMRGTRRASELPEAVAARTP